MKYTLSAQPATYVFKIANFIGEALADGLTQKDGSRFIIDAQNGLILPWNKNVEILRIVPDPSKNLIIEAENAEGTGYVKVKEIAGGADAFVGSLVVGAKEKVRFRLDTGGQGEIQMLVRSFDSGQF